MAIVCHLGGSLKIRMPIAAATALAALAGTGAFVLPGVASAAPATPTPPTMPATHTLKFISVEKALTQLSKTTAVIQDTDVNCKGKVIGYDVFYQTATSASTFDGWVSLAVNGGFIYATIKFDATTDTFTDGKVTGGTLAFKGAKGTVTVKVLSATKAAVKLTYTTP